MADHDRPRSDWDRQGLGFGLAFAFLGILFAVGRDDGSLRPVHLLGVVILAAGLALLVGAIDQLGGDKTHAPDDVIDLT